MGAVTLHSGLGNPTLRQRHNARRRVGDHFERSGNTAIFGLEGERLANSALNLTVTAELFCSCTENRLKVLPKLPPLEEQWNINVVVLLSWSDLYDLGGALLLHHIAEVQETSRVGRGDNRDDALPAQSHLQGRFLVMDLQSLTILESSGSSNLV
ncbi:hypothetical protein INR49_022218 [Caranx melampygus]|nr:hypothetical protein INR49_022218 [Caranx melampygus]